MKLKITLALIAISLAFSCKKDPNNGSLIGKWHSTQVLFPPGIYQPEGATGDLYVQFGKAGAIQSTYFAGCTSYSVAGNQITINFTGAADLTQAKYTYTIMRDTLKLYPAAECPGCVFPFVRE